jgi:hypothetical protein
VVLSMTQDGQKMLPNNMSFDVLISYPHALMIQLVYEVLAPPVAGLEVKEFRICITFI